MKKRAQATAIVWFVAIFIILFASIVFLSGVVSLNKKGIIKKMLGFGDEKIAIQDDTGATITLQKNFQTFLNMKTEFEGKEITILELAENNEIRAGPASDTFKSEARIIFNEILPYSYEKVSTFPWWLRVYRKDERVQTKDRYLDRRFAIGYTNCDPFTESSVTLAHYTENKKIILCVRKEYLKTLEADKIV